MFYSLHSSDVKKEPRPGSANDIPSPYSDKTRAEYGRFQYDWKALREMCTAGASIWGRQDPWQLLTCVPGTSGNTDPFDPLPQGQLQSIV